MIQKNLYPFHACKQKDIEAIFHVTNKTVCDWVKTGCPINPDRTYSVYNVHDFLLDREKKKNKGISESGDLGSQKTRKEIELLTGRIERQTIENDELRKNTVSKYLYNRAITTVIEAFTKYFVDVVQRNILHLKSIPESELPAAIGELGVQVTKHMVQSVKRVESSEEDK